MITIGIVLASIFFILAMFSVNNNYFTKKLRILHSLSIIDYIKEKAHEEKLKEYIVMIILFIIIVFLFIVLAWWILIPIGLIYSYIKNKII